MSNLIEVKNLCKVYDNGLITALEGINLSLESGKIYVLMGASGCGKSTLLNIIGTLDSPTSGSILYEGKTLNLVGNLHSFRRDFIGFIFQFHHLIPVLTLLENVESALLSHQEISTIERQKRCENLLEEMNILHRKNSFANEISGGERQRGAIARAFVNNPKLILADEPTGNLDTKTVEIILKKLRNYVQETNGTILIATHDKNVATIADVLIEMEDAKIVSIRDQL